MIKKRVNKDIEGYGVIDRTKVDSIYWSVRNKMLRMNLKMINYLDLDDFFEIKFIIYYKMSVKEKYYSDVWLLTWFYVTLL